MLADAACRIRWCLCVYHTLLGRFSTLDISTGAIVSVPKRSRSKHLAESFPKTCRSVLAPSWLSGNRAWKNAPGVCDTHRLIRHLLGKYPTEVLGEVRYARPQYPTDNSGKVRYELDTDIRHFGKCGTPTQKKTRVPALRALPNTPLKLSLIHI